MCPHYTDAELRSAFERDKGGNGTERWERCEKDGKREKERGGDGERSSVSDKQEVIEKIERGEEEIER